MFEAWLEEIRDVLQFAEAAVHEALGEKWGDFQRVGELSGKEWLWRGDCPTKFHLILNRRLTQMNADKNKNGMGVWKMLSTDREFDGWEIIALPSPSRGKIGGG